MNKDFVYEEQKQLIEMWKSKYYEQKEEVDRLNNIINQLEKWAKSIELTVYRSDGMPTYQYQAVLDKLKELKGE